MRNIAKRMLFGALSAAAICVVGARPAAAQQKQTIKLGYIGPLTGGNSEHGLGARNSFLLAIRQANASDYPYEVVGVVEDDASNPSVGVTAAVNLVSDPEVVAAIGHWNSPVALATIHIFHGFKTPLVIWAAQSPRITEFNYTEVTRVTPTLVDEVEPLAEWLIKERAFETFSIVSDTTEFGRDNIDYFTRFVRENGGSILTTDAVPVGTTDFGEILTRVRAARPDAIFFGGVINEGGIFRRQMVERGLTMPLAGAAGIFAPRFIELAGAAAEGTIVSVGGAPENPALQKFYADYDDANFEEPVSGSGQFAYDATNILLQAIREVGPDDKEALAMAIREIEFDGVLGTTTFDANGQTEAEVRIDFLAVKDGEWIDADTSESERLVTHVSAASLSGTALAPDSIATAFGQGLAAGVGEAMMTPLPTTLGGVTVSVTDSSQVQRLAQLLFVSPRQVSYVAPGESAAGPATVTVRRDGVIVSTETVPIDAVAPGVFSANGSGEGVAAALVQKISALGTSTFELVFSAASVGGVVAVPFEVGSGGDRTYLNLYGTGIRGRIELSAVSATVGGLDVPVLFAAAQGGLVGLDQVNIGPLPAALAGRGLVEVVVTVDGKVANAVTVSVR